MTIPRLPSQAKLLINRPVRGLMLKFSRQQKLSDNDESNHVTPIKQQQHTTVDLDTYENFPFLPSGSTVAVQHKHVEPWMHGIIIGHGSDDHHGRSYKIKQQRQATSSPGPKGISRPPNYGMGIP